MKRISLVLALGAMCATSSAFAADIIRKAPVVAAPVPFSWTGFYIGGFVGGAWGSEDPTDLNEYAFQTLASVPRSGVFHNWAYDLKPSVIAGGTIGYNYQIGSVVVGIEGEAGFIRLSGSGADPLSPGLDVVSSSTLGDWYGMITGRGGVVWDRALIYAKGGAVFTRERGTITDGCFVLPCGPVGITATGSVDVVAPVLGGGIEYAFTREWSAKIEYLYWALDKHFLVTGVATNTATYSWDHSFSALQTVKLGLNYSFRP
jgi:outer membrane immunogenic protein